MQAVSRVEPPFSKKLDLLLAVSSFVVFRTFVYVMLTIPQHSIDEAGEAMSHGGDGFGSTIGLSLPNRIQATHSQREGL